MFRLPGVGGTPHGPSSLAAPSLPPYRADPRASNIGSAALLGNYNTPQTLDKKSYFFYQTLNISYIFLLVLLRLVRLSIRI